LINFVDATNDANHYTKPPPGRKRKLCYFGHVIREQNHCTYIL